jgi:esterase
MQRDTAAPWAIPDGISVIKIGGYPLAYWEEGAGAPLVLIHGSLSDYRSWLFQVPTFARSHRVFALSLRHYYPERWNGRAGDFSLAQHTRDVAELIRIGNLGRVHLIGHSRGGGVALMIAMQHPELIASLTLADPRGMESLLPDTLESRAVAGEIDSAFARLHQYMSTGQVEDAARSFVDSLNGTGAWDRRPAEQKQWVRDNIGTAVDTGELPGLTGEAVSKFDFPILPVTGERSPARYAAGFAVMRLLNPALHPLATIRSASHAMHRENPKDFNAAVLEFLQSS